MFHGTGDLTKRELHTPNFRGMPIHFDRPIIVITLLFILYCAVFSNLSILKYNAFNNDLDMGNMLQAFYSTFHGRFLEMTWNGGDTNGCLWMGHTEIVFLLMFPIFALFPSAATLLILQTIAIAAGGIAVYLLARHLQCGATTSVALAACYWLYPLLASINLVDFHADAFIIAPHLFAWYFLRTGRHRLFWSMIVLGMLVKEHAFLFNGLLGLVILGSNPKRALLLFVLATVQLLVLTPLIQHSAGVNNYHLTLAQHVIGGSTLTPLQTLGAYWAHFTSNLFSGHASFILMIALTFNISLFLFPRGLIMIVPLVMIFIATGSVQTHRHAVLIAPLFITLVEGVAGVSQRRRTLYAIAGVFVPTVCALLASPDSLTGTNIRELLRPEFRNAFHYRYTRHDALADSLIRQIPADVPIAADAPLRTKLVNRERAFIHPSPHDSTRADFYLFDFFEKREYDNAWPARARISALLRSGGIITASHLDGLVILRKRLPGDLSLLPSLQPDAVDTGICSAEYAIRRVEIDTVGTWSKMGIHFGKVTTDTTQTHAFISLFIDQTLQDTLRVLHLASYTVCRLEQLPTGWYDETFYFQVPRGASIEHRRHEIWLYKKSGYLPFFSRQKYRGYCYWKKDAVPESEGRTDFPASDMAHQCFDTSSSVRITVLNL